MYELELGCRFRTTGNLIAGYLGVSEARVTLLLVVVLGITKDPIIYEVLYETPTCAYVRVCVCDEPNVKWRESPGVCT